MCATRRACRSGRTRSSPRTGRATAARPRRARERLAFEELLALQLGFQERRRALAEQASAPALGADGELIGRYYAALPFELTRDQQESHR